MKITRKRPRSQSRPSHDSSTRARRFGDYHLSRQEPTIGISHCHFCANIMRMAKMPLEKKEYHFKAGAAKDLRGTLCTVHRAILAACRESPSWSMWAKISMSKAAMQRTIEVKVDYAMFLRLALLPRSRKSVHPRYCGRMVDPSWFDMATLKSWKAICDENHPKCRDGALALSCSETASPPHLLIDTQRMCLCKADSLETGSYLALSYVWGASTQLRASTENLAALMRQDSLVASEHAAKIPQTIRDAMGLVRALGERYLWVDTLCIVQDDDTVRSAQIHAMASIYAGAVLTIVAAQGENADHGLPGISGVSRPRKYDQQLFRVAHGHTFMHCPDAPVIQTPWSKRGWTYQESLLSTRKLMFIGDTVEWRCHYAVFREDIQPEDLCIPISAQEQHQSSPEAKERLLLDSRWPRIQELNAMIDTYSRKNLTYPIDILSAFTGLSSALAGIFDGGLLYGIPEMFFDVGLLWIGRGNDAGRLRESCEHDGGRHGNGHCPGGSVDGVSTPILALPTWSWMGWMGFVHPNCWNSAWDYLKPKDPQGTHTSKRTVPLVKWYSHAKLDSPYRRLIPNHWRQHADVKPKNVPPGWTAHKHTDKTLHGTWSHWDWTLEKEHVTGYYPLREPDYFYTHESDPDSQFWYPIPLVLPPQRGCVPPPGSLISCDTKRAYMRLGERIRPQSGYLHVSIYEDSQPSRWAGVLTLHTLDGVTLRAATTRPEGQVNGDIIGRTAAHTASTVCELAAVSTGWAYNDWKEYSMGEWELPARPRVGDKYEWYNVMWIEWHGGVARRKAIGRVCKAVWESQGLEPIRLVLN
ncbi:heterokaryon incompatibility protein-domain-containing protein [Echria macrotheca]|uniref:Heterokaryon incompatibility protein-domain-containing protein n=1 Tax=Echria macrotheca TaxID=438768 RepID=A0AAJ0F775_9PEZI|nr:heterokaryon incompatibility protein-domain-containing protein [Echria macrotheca]